MITAPNVGTASVAGLCPAVEDEAQVNATSDDAMVRDFMGCDTDLDRR